MSHYKQDLLTDRVPAVGTPATEALHPPQACGTRALSPCDIIKLKPGEEFLVRL